MFCKQKDRGTISGMSGQNRKMRFSLNISADEVMKYYQGRANALVTHTDRGVSLRLPVKNFRPFVDEHGLRGHFEIVLDEENKLVSLKKLN